MAGLANLGCDRPDTKRRCPKSGATGGDRDHPVRKAARGPTGPPKMPFRGVTGAGPQAKAAEAAVTRDRPGGGGRCDL